MFLFASHKYILLYAQHLFFKAVQGIGGCLEVGRRAKTEAKAIIVIARAGSHLVEKMGSR